MRSNGSAKQNSNDASRPRLGVGSLLGDTTAAQPKLHLNWQKNCLQQDFMCFHHYINVGDSGTDIVKCCAPYTCEPVGKAATTSAQVLIFEASHNGKSKSTKLQLDKI